MRISDDFYGDQFRWFTGIVQDVGDDRSRVKVRIFGIHHTEDTEKVSNEDLPWAMVLYPTTGGQTSGGTASHGLVRGTWVVGFFVDGEDSQQPIVLGVINGGQNSINNSASGTPTAPGSQSSSQTSTSNPTVAVPGDTNTPTSQLSGNDNQTKVYNYFWERISAEGAYSGDLKAIVAAVTGNFNVESGCNPQAFNGNDRGETSVGIAQWRGGRYDRITPLLNFCGGGSPSKGNLPPLEKQLDFVWHELHTGEKTAYNKVITSTTIQDAVAGMIFYERDASYQKINGVWTVNRDSPFYQSKLTAARKVYSSLSYTGVPPANQHGGM
jgi:Phage tail lysozyme/Gp5 N-terminal OB domain